MTVVFMERIQSARAKIKSLYIISGSDSLIYWRNLQFICEFFKLSVN